MALHKAIKDGDEKLACRLAYNGADPNENDGGRTPLQCAVGHRLEMLTIILLLMGADASSALASAVPATRSGGNQCPSIVKILLEAGPSLAELSKALKNLLLWVDDGPMGPSVEYFEVLRLVIGCNPHVVKYNSTTGVSPLHMVSDRGTLDILVWAGADLEDRNVRESTPVVLHCQGLTRLDVVKGYVEYGAKLSDSDGNDSGALIAYYVVGHESSVVDARMAEIVDVLLRGGADETKADFAGKVGADYLQADKHPLTHKLLVNAPIDRQWRRRGLIVMCIARHAKFLVVQPVKVPPNENNDWPRLAKRLVEMGTHVGREGVFRTIVGFL